VLLLSRFPKSMQFGDLFRCKLAFRQSVNPSPLIRRSNPKDLVLMTVRATAVKERVNLASGQFHSGIGSGSTYILTV